jgi:hypothetical protein
LCGGDDCVVVVSTLLSTGELFVVLSGDDDNRLLPVLLPLVSVVGLVPLVSVVGLVPLVSVPVFGLVPPPLSAENDDSIDDRMVSCRDDGALLVGG